MLASAAPGDDASAALLCAATYLFAKEGGWGQIDMLLCGLEMLALLAEARIYRPQLLARFVLNRCAARTVIARETAETLADHDPPLMSATIGQRVAFADLAQSGRLVFEADDNSAAAREIAALTAEVGRSAP